MTSVTKPRINLYGNPAWYHHHGEKMKVSEFDKEKRRLVIAGSAAKVTISAATKSVRWWAIDWEVVQLSPTGEIVTGRRVFTSKELAVAFDVERAKTTRHSMWLLDQYGAECAEQGKYIRWKTWLNIPCPGTSHDGDPNVSIGLKPDITAAVRELLSMGQ